MKELIEKRNELKAKSDVLAEIFKVSGADRDLSLVKKMGEEDTKDWTTVQKAEKIKKLNDELTDLGKDVDTLAEVEKADKASKALTEKLEQGTGMVHPDADPEGTKGNGHNPQFKGIGTLFVESEQFKARKSGNIMAEVAKLDYGLSELKTLFQTSAGFSPEALRIGRLIEAVTRPIAILDVIPSGVTGMPSIVYMEETTRTHAAAEIAEGAAYPESTFAFTERTVPVEKIGASIPVTDEQLDDVPMIEAYLNNRLSFGVRQRLDERVLTGPSSSAPNIEGILNKSGIQTQAKGGDPTPDAIFKAMTLVQVTGRAEPNVIVLHPNDWEPIRLLRTADGIYIWGSPSEAGPERIWGTRIVKTTAETENTGLVGDFNHCQLFERKGIEVQVGFVGSNFTEGKKTIRADMRVGFPIYRATAFCTVTGI